MNNQKGVSFHTRFTVDPAGGYNLEVISHSFTHLKELEESHKRMGRRTWLNNYNTCDGSFMLTIQFPKSLAA